MKRFEGESSRQKVYSKRKDRMVRKAQELTILCETDLALLMFSPSGQLTSFGSNGRVEDTFLRFLEQTDEQKGGPIWNAEYLSLKLRELQNEAELLEKIATIEALEEKLDKINRQKDEIREKLRFYNPDVENISSVAEAEMHQKVLISALERIRLSKESIEALEEKLDKINRQKDEIREKLRFYNPDVENISSVAEAEMHQKVLISALERIRLSKENLFGEQTVQQDTESKEDKFPGKQNVGQDMESFEDKLLGEQIVRQDTGNIEGNLLGKQIVQQDTRSYEDEFLGKQIVLQDTESYEDKLLGKRIMRQENENNEDKLLGKQILQQDTGSYKDKLLGKQIVRQAISSYETAADAMKCPVPITEGSASTNKKRRGRPRKRPSSPMKTHFSMDFIRAQQGCSLPGDEHSSKMFNIL